MRRMRSGRAALIGAISGAAFYVFVALGVLYYGIGVLMNVGTDTLVCRVMADYISLLSLVAFGTSIAILISRRQQIRLENDGISSLQSSITEDTFLLPDDAREWRKQLRSGEHASGDLLVYRLLEVGLRRARANWAADDVAAAIAHHSDLLQRENEADYSTVKYLAWAIPSIGFIGTVYGIGNAIGAVRANEGNPVQQASRFLFTAFDTTLVALGLSLVLMYVIHRVQADDDRLFARAGEWCMSNLVLRMHISKECEK
jgi:biopolymer transport protein ExbB/TolQ